MKIYEWAGLFLVWDRLHGWSLIMNGGYFVFRGAC